MRRLRSALAFAVAMALTGALVPPMAAPAVAAPDGQITPYEDLKLKSR